MRLRIILLVFCCCFVNAKSQKQNKFINTKDIFGRRVFVENKGQFNNDTSIREKIYFALENGLEKIYFTKKGLVYKFNENKKLTEEEREKQEHKKNIKQNKTYYVHMNWINANSNLQIEESQKQNHYFTYGKQDLNAYAYKKITYKNVYNHIDFEYLIPEDKTYGIKYNIILHPGANISDIKMHYLGDVKKIALNQFGEVEIKTPIKHVIIEHTPRSYYQSNENEEVKSNYTVQNNTISFNFQNGYSNTQTLIIDPWLTPITSLSVTNYGYDVDYDNAGNLFVYGGDDNFSCSIAKYSPIGSLLWTFSGIVPIIPWSMSAPSELQTYPSNFVVEKTTGKCFVGQGLNQSGGRVIRIDAAGNYDSFVTPNITKIREMWELSYDCVTGNIYVFGGTPESSSVGDAAIINQTTMSGGSGIALSSVGSAAGNEVFCSAIDDNGQIFLQWGMGNSIGKVNSSFSNTIWYTTFGFFPGEASGKSAYILPYLSGGYNCLAVNGNYLYYYDGNNLAAFNKTTGALITYSVLPMSNLLLYGGIAVDDCDNIYVGGNGSIDVWHFTGTNFNLLSSIPLGATSINPHVYDIKLDKSTNLLYVSGNEFVGVYSAIHSLSCIQTQYSVTSTCSGNNSGNAITSLTTTIPNPLITYVWSNSTNTVSTTLNTTLTTNSVTLPNGTYTVSIQINAPCGPTYTSSVNINYNYSVTLSATTACLPGGNTTSLSVVTANGFTSTPTYTWTGPSAYISNIQNPVFLNNNIYGTYTLAATDGNCVVTTTVNSIPLSMFTPAITNTAITCNGFNNGIATTTISGGILPFTYTWSSVPIQNTSTANNLAPGTYSCIVQDNSGCAFTATTQITEPPALTLTATSSSTLSCTNSSVVLTASASGGAGSAYTYSWITGPSTPNYTVSETLGGTYIYTLIATDANNCNISNTVTLTFITAPTISVASVSLCAGQTATLTATGSATNYTWLPVNTNGTSYTTTPLANTAYTIIGALGSCSAQTTASITVNPLPTAVLTTTNILCNGLNTGASNVLVSGGTAPYNYTWTTLPIQNTATANNLSAGIYTCTIQDNTGCAFTTTAQITQPSALLLAISPSSSLSCVNSNIVLSANASGGVGSSYNYNWSLGPNTATYTINETVAGNYVYTLTATDANSCNVVSTVSVSFVPIPLVSVSSLTLCSGQTTTLTANGAASYTWLPGNTISNILVVNPSITTTYTVLGASGTCSSQSTATVTINSNPTSTLIGTNILCFGNNTGAAQAIVSGGTGPYTYIWSSSPIQTTPTAINLTAATYTCNITDALGCANSNTITLTQPPPATLGINSSTQSICAGSSVAITAFNSGGVSPYTYTLNSSPVSPTFSITETLASNYTYTIISIDANSCSISNTFSLTFAPIPTISVASATICAKQTATLIANSSATNYTWMPISANGYSYTASPNANTTYTIVAALGQCSVQTLANIFVNPLPNASIQASKNNACLPLCTSFICQSSASVQTDWVFGDGNIATAQTITNHCFINSGNYSVTANITDLNGCKNTAKFIVEVYPKPKADFNYSPLKPTINDPNVIFTDASYGAPIISWDWYFSGNTITHSSLQNPNFVYTEPGSYEMALVVKSNKGCIDTAVKTIVILDDAGFYVPSTFTPNDDGVNDVFQPKGYGIIKYELMVFDRWGQKIFNSTDFFQGWDGNFKGKNCKEDVYVWKIYFTNTFGKSKELNGHISLIR